MVRMTRSRSSEAMAVPEGRHRPRVNRSWLTLPPTFRQGWVVWNTGCICMGFHTGRDSMLSASRARRTDSLSAPNCSGVMRITLSHRLARPLCRHAHLVCAHTWPPWLRPHPPPRDAVTSYSYQGQTPLRMPDPGVFAERPLKRLDLRPGQRNIIALKRLPHKPLLQSPHHFTTMNLLVSTLFLQSLL
jgi:hypothetical protein